MFTTSDLFAAVCVDTRKRNISTYNEFVQHVEFVEFVQHVEFVGSVGLVGFVGLVEPVEVVECHQDVASTGNNTELFHALSFSTSHSSDHDGCFPKHTCVCVCVCAWKNRHALLDDWLFVLLFFVIIVVIIISVIFIIIIIIFYIFQLLVN